MQGGWATVEDVLGPDYLLVKNAYGEYFGVWHIGLIGPSNEQPDWRARGTDYHRRVLPPGTRIWLQRSDGLTDPGPELVFRHVYLNRNDDLPLGASLLRAGYVWVYPHATHSYWDVYADRQADAVIAHAGAWAQTGSSAIFHPRGESHGGFPVNPSVIPALTSMDSNALGHSLLVYMNLFPVEIGASALPSGSMGTFQPRAYTVQLSRDILNAPPPSIATVLFHELTHVKQMMERLIDGKKLDCYAQEVEAFGNQSVYWFSLYGGNGKPTPTHWLDRELNMTLRQYGAHTLDVRVHASYGEECAAA
jgi:hypothetical protein